MENKVYFIYYLDKSFDAVVSSTILSAFSKIPSGRSTDDIVKVEVVPHNVIM